MSGNGWCTHPDRQVSSDVRILVRKAELACRNAWGSDLWEDASSDEAPAARSGNNHAPQPEYSIPPAPVSYDDEVTSVVNADQHQASRAAALDDEIVEQSVVRFRDEDYDDEEQDTRRNLLYRNSRNAIEQARQRHMHRRQQPVIDPEEAGADNEDVVIAEGEESPESRAASLKEPVFEPDDFIEEETPKATPAVDEHDDALLSEGIRTLSPRARRLRRFREERPLPKETPVVKTEPDADDVELVLPPSAAPERGRFDSIPEISAEIDLPLLRRSSSANKPEERHPRPTMSREDHDETPSSYERALKRAHAVNAAARTEQNVQRRRATSTTAVRTEAAPVEQPGTHAAMPDLPEDDSMPAMMSRQESIVSAPAGPASHRAEATVEPSQPQGNMRRVLVPERSARSPQDPRRSWWRGNRPPEQEAHQTNDPMPVVMAESADSQWTAADAVDIEPVAQRRPEPAADTRVAPATPERVAFDLEREEDLESFRDRLFYSSPVQDEQTATTQPQPQRSPITVSRRQQRAIPPAARERYRAEREPARLESREAPPESRRVDVPQRRPDRPVQQPQPPVRQRHIEPEALLEEPADAWYEPEPVPAFDVRSLVEPDTELLDMTIEIAPEIPRACATCRNYRPSEQAGRGWCTNSWAFTHRQMVNETDLACDSTIGCWWLPADQEVWLTEFDVAGEPTPRVDRLIAHLHPERRAVGNE